MITQLPVGSIVMFADGAGTLLPQYAGSIDVFEKVFANGVMIQPSSSLHVNGLLEDKVVKHQIYSRTSTTADLVELNLTTEAQWYATGSYIFINGGNVAGSVTLYIGNPWNTPGLTLSIQKITPPNTSGNYLTIRTPLLSGRKIYLPGYPAYDVIWNDNTDYNSSIELISDSTHWYTKSITGTWTGV